jgi:hypothetical protein
MAISFRTPHTQSELISQEKHLTVAEQRAKLREAGFETSLLHPGPLSELSQNQQRIQHIFSTAEKDPLGRAILHLKQIKEVEKIDELKDKLLEINKQNLNYPMSAPTFNEAKFIEEQLDKMTGKDSFTTEEEATKLVNILNTKEGRSLLNTAHIIGKDAFSSAINYLNGRSTEPKTPKEPHKRVTPGYGGDDHDNLTKLDYQFEKKVNRLQLQLRPFNTTNINSDEVYSNSQLQRVYKQAILKIDLDKRDYYGNARRQNRHMEDKKRVDVNKRLKVIETKGQSIVAPMNAPSFNMVAGQV